jgi:putative hydrolase of the HAD superfamily
MKTESSAATLSRSQPEPLRAVVFDYGGVLTYLPTDRDWEKMAAIAGAELPKLLDAYWEHRYPYEVGHYDSARYWGLVARDCGLQLGAQVVRELVSQDNEQWGRPNPDTIALSRQLRSSGMRTALLSNMQPDMLNFVRERHPWLEEFEVRVISCEVAEAKPEPAIFTLTAERLGLPPRECLFLDDREANINGARQAGMRALHFESAHALLPLTEMLTKLGVDLG